MLNTQTGVLHQWLSVLDQFPEGAIAISVYCGGTLIVLLSWYFITKPYSKFCAISCLVLFSLLVTPTVSEGNNAALSPAIFGLLFGVLTKEHSLIWFNAAAIVFVMGLGLLCGFFIMKFRRARA
ncbi:hypothetical protein I2F27_05255 [Acinetobacter sp. B5B]|uniref:hypothetical protein n=1 Tax=Acinetobacter baretiae TaxID=2605383 RepID=UPI0018C1F911|nr:hypothetical protein [Acinetobacter baretiae]MBF7682742.1 hypothetical protein [Acinetobacter baretiae]MBF7684974.1 hypothetical protein [Acinetobacter baretiae]